MTPAGRPCSDLATFVPPSHQNPRGGRGTVPGAGRLGRCRANAGARRDGGDGPQRRDSEGNGERDGTNQSTAVPAGETERWLARAVEGNAGRSSGTRSERPDVALGARRRGDGGDQTGHRGAGVLPGRRSSVVGLIFGERRPGQYRTPGRPLSRRSAMRLRPLTRPGRSPPRPHRRAGRGRQAQPPPGDPGGRH